MIKATDLQSLGFDRNILYSEIFETKIVFWRKRKEEMEVSVSTDGAMCSSGLKTINFQ